MPECLVKKLNVDQSLENFDDETKEERLIEVYVTTEDFIHGGETCAC